MSGKRISAARESWLRSDDDDKVADASLLCVNRTGEVCAERCALDGFCFRGLGSAEVRWSVEQRLATIERDIATLMTFALDERRRLALTYTHGEMVKIRDNVLPFVKRVSP